MAQEILFWTLVGGLVLGIGVLLIRQWWRERHERD